MIEFHDALNLILSNAVTLGTEKVSLAKAHLRVLASDTTYDINLPPFNKSAMDGIACRMEDINNELEVIETIFAGKKPENKIGPNQCAKIMTGAVVPEGADCVIMKEQIEERGEKIVCPSGKTKTNICFTAEDVKVGDQALPTGTYLTSKHIPILAGAGIAEPTVYKQPQVTVFATGSELVEPSQKPAPHQIRNSNSSQMVAQVQELGLTANYGGIIKDSFDETYNKISSALEVSDVIIMSGGVSEGEFDFIPDVMQKLGFELQVTRIAVQPGKPIVFARKGNQYCIGCAGNPASSYIQFDLYIKPFLMALQGYNFQPFRSTATLSEDYSRKRTDRLLFMPAKLNGDGTVTPVEYHGAAHINALINANCLVTVPIGIKEIKKGEIVDVRSF